MCVGVREGVVPLKVRKEMVCVGGRERWVVSVGEEGQLVLRRGMVNVGEEEVIWERRRVD